MKKKTYKTSPFNQQEIYLSNIELSCTRCTQQTQNSIRIQTWENFTNLGYICIYISWPMYFYIFHHFLFDFIYLAFKALCAHLLFVALSAGIFSLKNLNRQQNNFGDFPNFTKIEMFRGILILAQLVPTYWSEVNWIQFTDKPTYK